jgi:hypothetical protein
MVIVLSDFGKTYNSQVWEDSEHQNIKEKSEANIQLLFRLC